MTPSINRLAEVAESVGNSIIEREWNFVAAEYVDRDGAESFDEFKTWIKDYNYYEGVVLACAGNLDRIMAKLQEDYVELELTGCNCAL